MQARNTTTRIRSALARRAERLGPRLLAQQIADGGAPRMSRQVVIDAALELGLEALERTLSDQPPELVAAE